MKPIATLRLNDSGPVTCCAGLSVDGETVFVLRKVSTGVFELFAVPVTEKEQSIASILSVDHYEAGRIGSAITSTVKPERMGRASSTAST